MIITDSLSSLQALKSQKLNNPIVSNILHMCHYLSGHKDIVFCWVPSHIGIQGNERADVLAKAALDKTKQFYYIPYTDLRCSDSDSFCRFIFCGHCHFFPSLLSDGNPISVTLHDKTRDMLCVSLGRGFLQIKAIK